MTPELDQKMTEVIQEFCDLKQIAIFITLEPIVAGENLVAPRFCSTIDDTETMRVLMQLAEAIARGQANILVKWRGTAPKELL